MKTEQRYHVAMPEKHKQQSVWLIIHLWRSFASLHGSAFRSQEDG